MRISEVKRLDVLDILIIQSSHGQIVAVLQGKPGSSPFHFPTPGSRFLRRDLSDAREKTGFGRRRQDFADRRHGLLCGL